MTPQYMPVVNLEKLNELADGEQELIREVLDLFIENTPKELARMAQALQNRDYKLVGEIAHKLRPTLVLIGLKTIEQALVQLEHRGLNNEDTETLQGLYEQIHKVCNEAIEEITNPEKIGDAIPSESIQPETTAPAGTTQKPRIIGLVSDTITLSIVNTALIKFYDDISFLDIDTQDIEQVKIPNFSIVLIDLKNETVALAAIAKLNATTNPPKTIILYDYHQENAIEQALKLGIGDFVNKLFMEAELPLRIKRLLK